MKNYLFLLIILILIIPLFSKAEIIINEIMYNPEGTDKNNEWIELYNPTSASFDLENWKLFENQTNHKLNLVQGKSILHPNDYLIITNSPDDFLTNYPGFSKTIFKASFSLKNSGEVIAIKDENLKIIDRVSYDPSWGGNGNGESLQRKNYQQNSEDSTNWTSGPPTPGTFNNFNSVKKSILQKENNNLKTAKNKEVSKSENRPPLAKAGNDIISFTNKQIIFDGSLSSDPDNDNISCEWSLGDGTVKNGCTISHIYLYEGTYIAVLTVSDKFYKSQDSVSVKIYPSEIFINEFLPNPSGKDKEEEWIEIYNNADHFINIGEWQLKDNSKNKPFIFPKNTFIAPKGYLVLSRKTTNIALNNDEDKIQLLLPNSNIVFQEISYKNPPENKSSSRTSQGFIWNTPTPGLPNLETTLNPKPNPLKSRFSFSSQYSQSSNNWFYANPLSENLKASFKKIDKEPTLSLTSSDYKNKLALIILTSLFFVGLIIIFIKIKNSKKNIR